MGNIFVTSDLHLCHDRDFIYGPRGFQTVEGMNKTIIRNWCELVTMDDDVYLLGDCFLNDNEKGIKLLRGLPGRIHIVWGNHDSDARKELIAASHNVVEYGDALDLKYKDWHFKLTHAPEIWAEWDYAREPIWRNMISLCGHSHVKDPFHHAKQGLIYHCELDAHDNKPVDIGQICADIIRYSEHYKKAK